MTQATYPWTDEISGPLYWGLASSNAATHNVIVLMASQ
jgi:hypothetical protein